MEAVYGPAGIKLGGEASRGGARVREVSDHLRGRGCGVVIAGCTELPLAVPDLIAAGTVIDPMAVTAAAIREWIDRQGGGRTA